MTQAEMQTRPQRQAREVEFVSQRQRAWRTFLRNRAAVVGLVMVIVIVAIAVAAPLLAPHDPLKQAPSERLLAPGADYVLGRDDFGRDILSRIIYGTRISLLVGILSVLLGGMLGTVMGIVAGFKGGRVEAVIMRVVDILLAFPDLITGLLVLAVLGSGLFKMIIAIGIVISPRLPGWLTVPRWRLRKKTSLRRRTLSVCVMPVCCACTSYPTSLVSCW